MDSGRKEGRKERARGGGSDRRRETRKEGRKGKVEKNERESGNESVVTDGKNKLRLHSQACLDSIPGVFTALMRFIQAGENNEIQTQVAQSNRSKTPENAGVGRLSIGNERGQTSPQSRFKCSEISHRCSAGLRSGDSEVYIATEVDLISLLTKPFSDPLCPVWNHLHLSLHSFIHVFSL